MSVGGKRGQPGLCLASQGSARFGVGERGAHTCSPHKPIGVRRAVSACVVTGINALVIFGLGLGKMVVWPWALLDLKKEHPSFSKWGGFFFQCCSRMFRLPKDYGEMNYISALGFCSD